MEGLKWGEEMVEEQEELGGIEKREEEVALQESWGVDEEEAEVTFVEGMGQDLSVDFGVVWLGGGKKMERPVF